MTKTTGLDTYSDRVAPSTKCKACGIEFQPKAMGYNGRYCSPACKAATKYARNKANDPTLIQRCVEYKRERIKTDPEFRKRHNANCEKSNRKTRSWLAEYKMANGCVDCGYRGHFSALQLDHEGPKSVEISKARSSIKRLKAEIEAGQCKVRCANCHSIKTWERKQKPTVNDDAGAVGKGCDQ